MAYVFKCRFFFSYYVVCINPIDHILDYTKEFVSFTVYQHEWFKGVLLVMYFTAKLYIWYTKMFIDYIIYKGMQRTRHITVCE